MSQELTVIWFDEAAEIRASLARLHAVSRDLLAHLDGDDSRVRIIRGRWELRAGEAPSASESVKKGNKA